MSLRKSGQTSNTMGCSLLRENNESAIKSVIFYNGQSIEHIFFTLEKEKTALITQLVPAHERMIRLLSLETIKGIFRPFLYNFTPRTSPRLSARDLD